MVHEEHDRAKPEAEHDRQNQIESVFVPDPLDLFRVSIEGAEEAPPKGGSGTARDGVRRH